MDFDTGIACGSPKKSLIFMRASEDFDANHDIIASIACDKKGAEQQKHTWFSCRHRILMPTACEKERIAEKTLDIHAGIGGFWWRHWWILHLHRMRKRSGSPKKHNFYTGFSGFWCWHRMQKWRIAPKTLDFDSVDFDAGVACEGPYRRKISMQTSVRQALLKF